MLNDSQGSLFESDVDTLTPSSADRPVSLQVLPDSEKDPLIIAGSGLTFYAWCVKSVPCGCWQRTLAECLASTLREYGSVNGLRHSLKISDTRSSPSFLVLKTSVRRMSESESGLWPTPTVNGNNNQFGRWEKSGDGLATAVKKYWPTPTRDYLNRKELKRKKRVDGLETSAMRWRTPTADDCNARVLAHNDRGELKLSGQVQKWATPQAWDSTDCQRSAEALARAKKKGGCANLREQVTQWGKDSANTNGKPRASSSLNPRWELQLMGVISDWLDIGTERLSKLWAMRLSRKSQKSSQGR